MNGSCLLEMRHVGKSYPGVRALDDVGFELKAGEVHVLLGENGAGKSTLMKILSGACQPDAGELLFDGQPVRFRSPREAREAGINTIYQELSLIPHLPVYANVFLGRERMWGAGILNRRAMREETARVLDRLGIHLDPIAMVRSLSIAQQQMVEVARALAFESRILIMDEPTSALTTAEIRTLFGLIRRVRERGVGIVYISHRMEEIFELGDRVTVLRDGRHIATRPVAGVSVGELIRLMADRELKEHFPRRPTPSGDVVLEVRDLASPGKLQAVSFVLRQGEILGVAGLMGSGRSTLARVLFGAERACGGTIRVHGYPARWRSPARAVGGGMGLLPEDRQQQGLALALSLEQNISLANTPKTYSWGLRRGRAQRALAEAQVSQLRIKTPHVTERVVTLSGGNQQKVVLGKWLARESSILVMDEPTRGIDVAAKVDIYETMNRLTARGVGILMISSDLPEVLGMSDRILVLRGGRVGGMFTRAEASQEAVLHAALGEAA
jgi:ribose transport system ATP-binding protein